MKYQSLLIVLIGFAYHPAYCAPATSLPDSTIISEDSIRTPESIHVTINANIKSLSHLRRTYQKAHAGFKGMVKLKLGIASSGIVVENRIISSTTGFPEFDEAVRDTIFGWRFKRVRKKDIVHVNIPIDFSKHDSDRVLK